ncbi:hypothetical protein GCM10028784_15000 [Myceligenerans cantabricum]
MTKGSETVNEPGAEQSVAEAVEPAEVGTEAPDVDAGHEDDVATHAAPADDTTAAPAAAVEPAEVEPTDTDRAGNGLQGHAAERLHALVERGAERIPGDQGGAVSKFAVALLSFGSAMTQRGDDKKETSALATDAVKLFKSLDDDPSKQREAMEKAISDLGANLVGAEERDKVVDVAQEAMGLWKNAGGGVAGAAGAAASLAKSDSALSLRSLAGLLRRGGDEDGAAKSEEEARKLEE